ncbi:Protein DETOXIFICATION 1 [Chlorella vulgaris]
MADSEASSDVEDVFEFQAPGSLPDYFGAVVGSPIVPFGLPLTRRWRPNAASLAASYEDRVNEATWMAIASSSAPATAAPQALPKGVHAASAEAPPGSQPAHESDAEAEKPTSEISRILRLAAPLSVSNLAGYAISMVVIAATGHLGESALSVVVLATSVFNVTGLSVLIGFSSAMETFCGQAYGAGRYHLVGLVLQRALLLLTLVAAAVAVLWTQAEAILLALGQDPDIAHGTAQFLLRATPALWFTGVFEALKRYLMAQEAVRPATAVTVISLCLAPLYNWLLIYKLGLGLNGAAYAMDAMQATLALLLAAYCVARDVLLSGSPVSTWHGFSRKAWQGWGQYCKFALPSVMVLMSGLLPDPKISVSVMGLCIQTSGLCYMMVTGLACAASVRVSNSLGARRPEDARRSTWTAWGLTMCLQAVVAAAIVLVRHDWPRLFTTSPAVIERTAHLLPLFALSLFGDGTNAVLQGLLRGAGKQETGAITNLLSYWCCGIPLAAYLAFKRNMGLDGLWWGLVAINTMQGGIMLTLTALFDFQAQADKAVAMLAQSATRPDTGGEEPLSQGSRDPLLAPLLPAHERRMGVPPTGALAMALGAKSPHAQSQGAPSSLRERLSRSAVALLTEGVHMPQPQQRQCADRLTTSPGPTPKLWSEEEEALHAASSSYKGPGCCEKFKFTIWVGVVAALIAAGVGLSVVMVIVQNNRNDNSTPSGSSSGNSGSSGSGYTGPLPVPTDPAPFTVPEGNQAIWWDEFDGDKLDGKKWKFDTGTGEQWGWGNNESQSYSKSSDNVRVADGNLYITALQDGDGYTSGRINTKASAGFYPGMSLDDGTTFSTVHVEASVQLPAPGQGLWPAFWLLPSVNTYGDWPASGEIDVLESINNMLAITQTLHFGGAPPDDTKDTIRTPQDGLSDRFHTVAVDWAPDKITLSIDGAEIKSFFPRTVDPNAGWFTAAPNAPPAAPFDQPFYIILNLAVGGLWPGPPDGSTTLPATFTVDYVRAWGQPSSAMARPHIHKSRLRGASHGAPRSGGVGKAPPHSVQGSGSDGSPPSAPQHAGKRVPHMPFLPQSGQPEPLEPTSAAAGGCEEAEDGSSDPWPAAAAKQRASRRISDRVRQAEAQQAHESIAELAEAAEVEQAADMEDASVLLASGPVRCARRYIAVTQRRPGGQPSPDGICLPPPAPLRCHHVVLPQALDLQQPPHCIVSPQGVLYIQAYIQRRGGS